MTHLANLPAFAFAPAPVKPAPKRTRPALDAWVDDPEETDVEGLADALADAINATIPEDPEDCDATAYASAKWDHDCYILSVYENGDADGSLGCFDLYRAAELVEELEAAKPEDREALLIDSAE